MSQYAVMNLNIKLNCDLGEGYGTWNKGDDAAIMPYIDMANIACGFHASDYNIMVDTVNLAKSHSVTIGAHPGYPDLHGFGRRDIKYSNTEISNMLYYQIGALHSTCVANDAKLSYVKPHGAMYNKMMIDLEFFTTIVKAIAKLKLNLSILVQSLPDMSLFKKICKQHSVPMLTEGFADRAYTSDGQLLSRAIPGAVHSTKDKIVTQAKSIIETGIVKTLDGDNVSLKIDSLCVHGDNELALAAVKTIAKYV